MVFKLIYMYIYIHIYIICYILYILYILYMLYTCLYLFTFIFMYTYLYIYTYIFIHTLYTLTIHVSRECKYKFDVGNHTKSGVAVNVHVSAKVSENIMLTQMNSRQMKSHTKIFWSITSEMLQWNTVARKRLIA